MHPSWIRSAAALPRAGQPVEFLIDHRDIAIDGTYSGQVFCSRWTRYDVERVSAWRLADLPLVNRA